MLHLGVVVYIWMPNARRIGHASMELSNGTYISWWPLEDKNSVRCEKGKKVTKKGRQTLLPGSGSTGLDLSEDEEEEGGLPTHTYKITKKLDEDAMEEWWGKWSATGHYELLSFNCCWAVYTCLRKGGSPRCGTIVWRPVPLKRYIVRWLFDANALVLFLNFPWFD